jgi:hypothetical protein
MDTNIMVALLQLGNPKQRVAITYSDLRTFGYIDIVPDPDSDPNDGEADTVAVLTEKGKVYVNALRAVPEPVEVTTWVIPEKA